MEHTTTPDLERLDAVLEDVAALAAAAGEDTTALLAVAHSIEALRDRLDAVRLEVLRHAEWVRDPGLSVAERIHATNTVSLSSARGDVRLAKDLADRFPIVARAWRDGTVSSQQARSIVAGLKHLPLTLSVSQLEVCQAQVISYADRFDPDELRQIAQRMVEVIDPDHAEALEADRVKRDARIAHARRCLTLAPDHHGSMMIRGQLPIADGQVFLTQLDALMPSAASYGLTGEIPQRGARRADALMRWCQMTATTTDLPDVGGDRPHVVLTLTLDVLMKGLGVATLIGCHEPVTASEARRLSCDAHLTPAVLGGASQPLDVGRTHRFFPKPLRTALVIRDQGCAFPGCDAPPSACEAHHITPWWVGGATSLHNGVVLCAYHHRLVEPDPALSEHVQWHIHIDPTTATPWFTPPRSIDPQRRPRLHHRYLLNTTSPPTPPPAPTQQPSTTHMQSSLAWIS